MDEAATDVIETGNVVETVIVAALGNRNEIVVVIDAVDDEASGVAS